jgi:signal transduction histidine kinase
MKRPSQKNYKLQGAIIFFFAVALIIQIAVLTFDFISKKTTSNTIIAILMLLIILFFSTLFTIIDLVRRKIAIETPLEKILDATEKISKGDFSVKLQPTHPYGKFTDFDLIYENINTLSEELAKTKVIQSDFISNISHEIKTPISIISGYTTLLQDNSLSNQDRLKYTQTIINATTRLSDLVSNVLLLTKLENQKIKPELNIFDLEANLSNCIINFEESIDKKNILLDCNLFSVKILSNENLLELVWNNLISNAIKFTNEGGKILISLKTEFDNAIISVSDTGCGISSEDGERIFDKFYQADTSHKQEGNGLGLALTKRILAIEKGDILAEKFPGGACRFTVTLSKQG